MRPFWIIALLNLCLLALTAQEANPPPETALKLGIGKGTISLQMLSFAAPAYINTEIIAGVLDVREPALLGYGMRISPLLGFAYTGEWLKLGIGLPLCGLIAYGAYETRNEPSQAFANSVMNNAYTKLAMYSTYDIYGTLRGRAQAGAYKYDFKPVTAAQAAAAPFRYDFLADPYVSIGLASLGAGALAFQWLSGGIGVANDSPGGNTARWRGTDYSAAGGTALYWMESIARNYFAAVGEEAFDRGYVLPELVEYLGPIAGIGVSAALFALGHYYKGANLIDLALSYLPPAIFYGILSYSGDFDFRKAAFVHFNYNLLLQAIYFFTRSDIKFTDGGFSAANGASFSLRFEL